MPPLTCNECLKIFATHHFLLRGELWTKIKVMKQQQIYVSFLIVIR